MQIKSDGTIETKLVVDGKEFVDSMSQYDRTADAFAQKVSKSVGKVKSDIESFAKAMGVTAAEAQRMMDSVSKNMALDAAAKALVNFSEKNRLAASATAELAAKLGVADRLFQAFGSSAKTGADKALQSIQVAAQAMQRMQTAMVFDPASNFKASGFDSNFDQFFSNIERQLNTTRDAAKNAGVQVARVIDDFYRASQHSGVVQGSDVAASMFRESANIEAAFKGTGRALDPVMVKIAEIPPALGSAAAAAKAFQAAMVGAGTRAQGSVQIVAGALKLTQAEIDSLTAKAQRGIELRIKTDALRRLAEDAQLSKKEIASLEKQLGVTLNETRGIGKEFSMIFRNTFKYGAAYMILAQLQQVPAQIYEATAAMDKFRKSYEGVFGARAGETQNYITAQADMFGKGLIETSKSYLKFAASAEYAGVSTEQTRKIFEATTKAITKVGGSTDDVNGSLVAMQQMISKGTVSAEEFRSQFAERIPGAMKMGADALGVTTAEFRKMMEEGQVISKDFIPRLAMEMENFAVGWERGAQTVEASAERMKNAFVTLFDSPGLSKSIRAVTDIITDFVNNISAASKMANAIGSGRAKRTGVDVGWSAADLALRFAQVAVPGGGFTAFSGSSESYDDTLKKMDQIAQTTEYAKKLRSELEYLASFEGADVAPRMTEKLESLRTEFSSVAGGQAIIDGLKAQANEYFKVLVDIQSQQLDFSPSGESADEMAAKIKELEAQIRRLTGQEWNAYVTVNVDTSQVAKAIAYINAEFAKTSMGKAEDAASSYESGLNAQKILASEISDLQGKLGTALDPREYFSTLSAIEEKNALYARGLEVLVEKQEAAAKAQKDVFDNTSAGQALAHAEKEISAANRYNTAAEKRLQVETEYKQAIERYAPLVNDAALSETQRAKAQEALAAAEKVRKGRLDDIATAEERAAKSASRSGASAAKAAQQAENFLESLSDQIAMAEAALSGDTLQTKLAQVDKKWNDLARRVDMGLSGAKLSAEEAAEAMARIGTGRAMEKQAVEAQEFADALKRVADIMGEIADASGSPDLKIKAGMMDVDAWYQQSRQAIDQATQDETQRAELVAALDQGVALKRLEVTRDAYESMSSVSQKYWDAEAALIEARLGLVKESADDELAYKIFAAQEWDDFQRRKLESQANAPRSQGDAIRAVFALDSGSYKSQMGQLQDSWKTTAERMLSLSDDLSSGIAHGLGDALRGLASGDIKSFEDVWKSMLNRLLDSFISFLEDMLAEWLKKNVFGALLGGSSSGGGAGVGDILGSLVGPAASALFQGGASSAAGGIAASATGTMGGVLGSSGLASLAGSISSGAGAAAGAALGTAVLPVIGTIIGAGLGILGGLLSQQEEEKPPQEVWQGRSLLYTGGTMMGYGYTQMDDGSHKLSAVDPMEMEESRKRFKDTVDDLNSSMRTLEIEFDPFWDRAFTFFMPPVSDELSGMVEFAMKNAAAASALGNLTGAVMTFRQGLEAIDETLGRLADAYGLAVPLIEPLGIDLQRLSGAGDDALLSLAALATGFNSGVALIGEAMQAGANSTEMLTDSLIAVGEAGQRVVNYFETYRHQLQNLALAQYSELLIDVVGGEDAFKSAMAVFSENAIGNRERAEANVEYYRSEFTGGLADIQALLPNFQASWIGENADAFWAAYAAAMNESMPPSIFTQWAEIAQAVANMEEAEQELADIRHAEWAWEQKLNYRKFVADGLAATAEQTQWLIEMEQELADARSQGATYAQQAALVETQIYEMQAKLNELLGQSSEAEDYGTALTDLQDAISWQIEWTSKLATEALAASGAFKSLGESLRDTIDSISADALLPNMEYAKYRTQMSGLFKTAMSGTDADAQEAMGKLGDIAQSMLDAASRALSYQEYDALKARTVSQLSRAAAYSERQAEYQGVAGDMYTAQGGLLERMLSESKASAPDAAFIEDANSLLSLMSGVSDAAKAVADGGMSADTFRALAGQTESSIMQTDLLGQLLDGTLDMAGVSQSQAQLLLSSVDALDALSDYTGRDVDLSDQMRQQLEIIAAGVTSQDQWASLITTIQDGQAEYIEWLKTNIASRREEADRLYALQEQQTAAADLMNAYFETISQYLLKMTQVETLSASISDLTSTANSYRSMAMSAMIAGVPMVAMMHMQTADNIMAQVAALQEQLNYWASLEVEIPALASGGIATAPTLAMIGEGGAAEVVAPLGDLMSPLHEMRQELAALRRENSDLQKQIAENTALTREDTKELRRQSEKQTTILLRQEAAA